MVTWFVIKIRLDHAIVTKRMVRFALKGNLQNGGYVNGEYVEQGINNQYE